MSAPTLMDFVAMTADLYRHEAVNAGQAVAILAEVADIHLYTAALMIREFERQEHGEPAAQWTPEADDWRRPERGPDGTWC